MFIRLAMGALLTLGFSHFCFPGSGPDERDTSTMKITVHVFAYAGGSLEAWKSAQGVATRIFNQAGIEVIWITCSLSSDGRFLQPGCSTTPQPGVITLHLVPTSRSTRNHFGNSTLGLAVAAGQGDSAGALVFYDRVEQLAKGGGAPTAVILGHAAAHEIGHVLLGTHTDMSLGVMSGRWSRSTIELARDKQLSFTNKEVATIRKEVRRLAATD
jgi:hypothetical protein